MKPLSEKAKNLIDGQNFASVATVMPDGSPQVAPLWVDRDGDVVLINTTDTRQRTRNLRRDPRIAISIFDMKNPYSNVLIRGHVVEITKTGAEDHIDKLDMKYRGRTHTHKIEVQRVILRIEATHVTG